MLTITKAQWDKISNDYKGEWTRETYNYRQDFPIEWIGKRTVFAGCIEKDGGTALATEVLHFEIIDKVLEKGCR